MTSSQDASHRSDVEHALPEGADTMSPAMADMVAYPRYLFRQVADRLGERVWEIGVGYGTYTEWLLQAEKRVLATDIDEDCLAAARRRFSDSSAITTARVDLNDRQSVRSLADYRADSVLCFNVLEHIEDDVSALNWIRTAVVPGATMALIVPAHQWLFGKMDVEAGHFRRYSRNTAKAALVGAGWKLDSVRYINVLGAAGWCYHNRFRKDAGLADRSVNRQMRSADRWLPRIGQITDGLFSRIAGLSVVAIAHS